MVSLQRRTAIRRQNLLMPPLTERKEERKKEGAAEQPRRNARGDCRRPRDGTQHKTRRNHGNIHIGDPLEKTRIGALHHRIEQQHGKSPGPIRMSQHKVTREGEPEGKQRKRHSHRGDLGDEIGRDGTQPLHRMKSVRIVVRHVVKEIERTGDQGERKRHRTDEQERTESPRHRRLRRIGHGEEPRREHDGVLRPLVDA